MVPQVWFGNNIDNYNCVFEREVNHFYFKNQVDLLMGFVCVKYSLGMRFFRFNVFGYHLCEKLIF